MSLARKSAGGRKWRPAGWLRVVLALVIVAIGVYMSRREEPEAVARTNERVHNEHSTTDDPSPSPRSASPSASRGTARRSAPTAAPGRPAPAAEEQATSGRGETIIADQRIYDLARNLIYEGDIDVGPTLARIDAGKRLRFPNDGATFQNRERRLPQKPTGYYREYVHPTEELLPSPGPQRIVIGEEGEAYYTPDHYRTFRRLDR